MGREQEDCRGEEGSEEREEASGRARAWEGDLGLGLPREAGFQTEVEKEGGEEEGERGTGGGGPHQNYLIK